MKKGIIKSLNIAEYAAYMEKAIDCSKKDGFGNPASGFFSEENKQKAVAATGYMFYRPEPSVENFFTDWNTTQYSNRDKGDTDFARRINFLEDRLEYSATYNQPVLFIGLDDEYVYVDFGYYKQKHFYATYMIPLQFCEIELYKDYSDTPVAAIGTNAVSGLFPSVPGETEISMKNKIASKQEEIEAKQAELEAEKTAMQEEIDRMKQEIEARYQSTFDLLSQKKNELDLAKQQLENELFVLDAQIYGIRCHNGEVINFTQLTSGERAEIEAPLVIYQKIRFLDEELSKYVALYGFEGDEESKSCFEELIKARSDMRDLFFPSGKSLTLVRITRDNKTYASGQALFTDGFSVGMQNVIEKYEVYHGMMIAILLRDGDNCYIGWTDDERFKLYDGNAFLTPTYDEDEVDDGVDIGNLYRTDKSEVATRFYLFSTIQGIIEKGLINLPKDVSVVENSHYIVFSMADNWLTDKGHGTLSEILEKYSGKIRVGDDILTTQSLRAEHGPYVRNNDRGIGYADRTHDVRCDDNTIYPVNYIEKTDTYIARYTCNGRERLEISGKWNEFSTVDEFLKNVTPGAYTDVTVEPYEMRDIYISLEKQYSGAAYWSDNAKKSRANFNLEEGEYIPLTFINSDMIKNVLITRELGTTFSNYNFSSSIKYLNHMIEYLTKREEEEENLIRAELGDKELPDEWRMLLSDWKVAHDVHRITEYQARRFAKTLLD